MVISSSLVSMHRTGTPNLAAATARPQLKKTDRVSLPKNIQISINEYVPPNPPPNRLTRQTTRLEGIPNTCATRC